MPDLVKANHHEPDSIAKQRVKDILTAWPSEANKLQPENLSICRELFGLAEILHHSQLPVRWAMSAT